MMGLFADAVTGMICFIKKVKFEGQYHTKLVYQVYSIKKTYKTKFHDIAKILLELELNTNQSITG
jgi:hypothetical protein